MWPAVPQSAEPHASGSVGILQSLGVPAAVAEPEFAEVEGGRWEDGGRIVPLGRTRCEGEPTTGAATSSVHNVIAVGEGRLAVIHIAESNGLCGHVAVQVGVKRSGHREARVAGRGGLIQRPAAHLVRERDEAEAEVGGVVSGALHEFLLRGRVVHSGRRSTPYALPLSLGP